jgi:hypothetical protein
LDSTKSYSKNQKFLKENNLSKDEKGGSGLFIE